MAAVILDDVRLRMEKRENEQEHILPLTYGEMMLLWQRHCPSLGQVLEINTGAYISLNPKYVSRSSGYDTAIKVVLSSRSLQAFQTGVLCAWVLCAVSAVYLMLQSCIVWG